MQLLPDLLEEVNTPGARAPTQNPPKTCPLSVLSGHKPSIREAAKMLGGEATGNKIICPGPGHSRKDRSLSVLFGDELPDGFVVRSFAGDDDLVCKDWVRARLGMPVRDWRLRQPSDLPQRQPKLATDDQPDRIRAGLAIWHGARNIRGTPAESYLASRGLKIDEDLSHVLRFSSSLKLDKAPAIAMVALYRDAINDDELCGVHRTFLHPDGRPILDAKGSKIRRMLGRAQGAAIKLDAHVDVTLGLHLGEGIETCLAARQCGYRPTCATGSAKFIEAFPVLAGIEAINIFAENDQPSRKAANACGQRYVDAGCEAWMLEPNAGDMNDYIRSAP